MGERRGLRTCVTVLLAALLASQTGVVAATSVAATEGPPTRILNGQRSFSPNGDGDKDRITLNYRLGTAGPVRMRVGLRGETRKGFAPFFVRLGSQPAGDHTWTWDGRDPRGKVMPHGQYVLELRTSDASDAAFVDLDLKFEVRLSVAERYGTPPRQVQKVYPRSRAVRDGIRLQLNTLREGGVRSGAITIRNTSGRAVAQRAIRSLRNEEMVWEARDGRGRPLPPGRYVAHVSGVDEAGNSGVGTNLRLWVSRDRLEWREETRQLTPQETRFDPCDWSTSPECRAFLPCGEVTPSTRIPGGLTHSTEPCAPGEDAEAVSAYFVPMPEAVRGVDAIRVAFTGEPTTPGTDAVGHLNAGSSGEERTVSSSSAARTEWIEDPWAGDGQRRTGGSHGGPRVLPGALWSFWTDGPAAFDVGTFTLDLRYLAVAD